MAGGQERILRRRIKSVESTKKITHAMELIAGSRIYRARQAIAAARPYVAAMGEVVEHLVNTPEAAEHPLLRARDGSGRVAIVVISADRGLAGAYNSNVIRAAERRMRELREQGSEVSLVAVGRKADSYFAYRRQPVRWSLTGVSERPSYNDARRVAEAVTIPLSEGELEGVELVYTRFVSASVQQVDLKRLVPLEPGSVREAEVLPSEEVAVASGGSTPGLPTLYEFEPGPEAILDRLVPAWVEAEIFAAMLESAASEHASRQRAMKSATDNADELIKTLRRIMNRARQDSITTEIMEIVGGAEALRHDKQAAGGGLYAESLEPSSRPA